MDTPITAAAPTRMPPVAPLDLRSAAIAGWLTRDRDLAAAVREVEDLESWPVDAARPVQEAAEAFGKALAAAVRRDGPDVLQRLLNTPVRDNLRIALAYLRAGRRLRTLAWIAAQNPDQAAATMRGEVSGMDAVCTILHPDPDGARLAEEAARSLRACVRQVNRLCRLGVIFGADRVNALLSACAMDSEDLAYNDEQEGSL